jgi:hypothetical protein
LEGAEAQGGSEPRTAALEKASLPDAATNQPLAGAGAGADNNDPEDPEESVPHQNTACGAQADNDNDAAAAGGTNKSATDANREDGGSSPKATTSEKQQSPKNHSGSVREKLWEERFQRLKVYKEKHGTCDVVKHKAGAELYRWVSYERDRIKKVQKLQEESPDKVKPRDAELAQRLLDFGFVVEQGTVAQKEARKEWGPQKEAMWDAKIELLRHYKEAHGTIEMSRTKSGWSIGLDRWVSYQALQRRKYEEDPNTSGLDETRIQRLKDLGVRAREKKEVLVTITSKNAPSWDEMFEQLRAFKEEHGHAEVPYKPKTLVRNWTLMLREDFEKMKEGKSNSLTPERMSRLTGLGFRFRINRRMPYDQRAAEWLEYKTKHGRDPARDSGPLGAWVGKMRHRYTLFKEGKKTCMTQEQVDKLTSWGFTFETGFKKPVQLTARKTWRDRYEQLVAFQEAHGHVNVPQAYPELGTWVHHQRRAYRKLKRGDKSSLSREKMQKLKALGFKWITRKSPTRPRKDGDESKIDQSDEDSSSEEEDEEDLSGQYYYQRHVRNPGQYEASSARPQTEFAGWERFQI